jgi:hypothetical protein
VLCVRVVAQHPVLPQPRQHRLKWCPIQRCEFAFLAEALGLSEDFSRPAHTSALRAILREAGLTYRVELGEEGQLIARITSRHDITSLAEVGDFDDALEAECGSEDYTLMLWDLSTGQVLHTTATHFLWMAWRSVWMARSRFLAPKTAVLTRFLRHTLVGMVSSESSKAFRSFMARRQPQSLQSRRRALLRPFQLARQ